MAPSESIVEPAGSPPESLRDLAPGMMVTPSVRLVSPLGAGGMGSVWVAEHLGLRTRVVVKFMAENLAKVPAAVERFSREAAAASQVKSPHVVQTLDYGVQGGRPYIVMELLEGHDLAAHIAQHAPLPKAQVASIVSQLARALAKAHALGIVHRDIKPSNIFLLETGDGEPFVKLLDFGIAKASALAVGHTTESGSFLGSPLYMSPEQLLGQKEIDLRADLWAVGVVAFEALTGQRPFVAETIAGLALRIHQHPPPQVTAARPELPEAMNAWFAKACARVPAERFGTSRELADALAEALGLGARPPSEISAHEPPRVIVSASDRPASEPAELGLARTAAQSTGDRPRSLVLLAAGGALVVGLAAAVWSNSRGNAKDAAGVHATASLPVAAPDAGDTHVAATLTPPPAFSAAPVDSAPRSEPAPMNTVARTVGAAKSRPPTVGAPSATVRHGAAAPSAARLPAFDDDIK